MRIWRTISRSRSIFTGRLLKLLSAKSVQDTLLSGVDANMKRHDSDFDFASKSAFRPHGSLSDQIMLPLSIFMHPDDTRDS